jgi:hypothetical protein
VSATLLPIVCAWCGRVRTSPGRWEETDLVERSPTEATHGICPDCLVEEKRAAAVDLALS